MTNMLRSLWLLSCTVALLAGCQERLTPSHQLLVKDFPELEPGKSLQVTFSTADESPILIKIMGQGVITFASVIDQNGTVLNTASVDYRRGVPLYLVIEPGSPGRQYRLEILIKLATHNSSINVEISGLPLNNRQDSRRLSAYKHYSSSIQNDPGMELTLWHKRRKALVQATELFNEVGLQQEQLWSEFLSAAIIYHPIADIDNATAEAADLADRAAELKQHDVAVMAMQVYGQTLMWRANNESSTSAKDSLDNAKVIFRRASDYALNYNQNFQHAWALNNLAIAHHYAGEFHEAIGQYEAALSVADPLQDEYLEQVIKSNMTATYLATGELFPALDLLQAATQYQRNGGQFMELGFSLDRMGDIYARLYQFNHAIDAYFEALEIARSRDDAETIGLWELSLGQAYYELGYMERALDYINESITYLKQMNTGTGLYLAHGVAAGIHRFGAESSRMQDHRLQQGKYLTSDLQKARYEFEIGKDMITNQGTESQDAATHFISSLRQAGNLDDTVISLLSQLYLCKAGWQSQAGDLACESDEIAEKYQSFVTTGLPKEVFEAKLLWSEILAGNSQPEAAIHELNGLINEITYYRTHLPGVMGAWYWQSRTRIFQTVMDLQVALDIDRQAGSESFLLLDRLRNIELNRIQSPQTIISKESSNEIRSLLATVENASNHGEQIAAERKLEQALLNRPTGTIKENTAKDEQWLMETAKSLAPDAAVLTYYFSTEGVFAWIIDAQQIRVFKLTDNPAVAGMVQTALENIRVIGYTGLEGELDDLGTLLVQPLASALPETVYFIPGGPFNGFPFEALRNTGRYLGEVHSIINLMSLDALDNLAHGSLENWTPGSIFLSGNPQNIGSAVPELDGSLTELNAIESIMSSSAITKITGRDFTRSSLKNDALRSANLVHIASHGLLDMSYPELSRISLSSNTLDGTQFLTPAEIPGLNLTADLIVLSACETTGTNKFRFDSNLGFVTELLASGTHSVIASLFPVSDRVSAEFMSDFYTELARTGSVKKALVKAKRNHIKDLPVRDWAAFQMSAG